MDFDGSDSITGPLLFLPSIITIDSCAFKNFH